MRNHDEKCRDMARSVLPSTARRRARAAKRALHKRERSWTRSYARAVRSMDPLLVDEILVEPLGRPARRRLVAERREADKVAPLIRWARRVVAMDAALGAMDVDGQLEWFESVLPHGVVGQHALSHLAQELDERPWQWASDWSGRGRADRLAADLEEVLAAGALGELNLRLKQQVAVRRRRRFARGAGTPAEWYVYWPRLFHGRDDLDSFAAAVRTGPEGDVVHAVARELRGAAPRR